MNNRKPIKVTEFDGVPVTDSQWRLDGVLLMTLGDGSQIGALGGRVVESLEPVTAQSILVSITMGEFLDTLDEDLQALITKIVAVQGRRMRLREEDEKSFARHTALFDADPPPYPDESNGSGRLPSPQPQTIEPDDRTHRE